MRASNFREVHWLTGISRLCLCLAVVGIITLGAADSTAAASATGNLPEIKVFSAEPLTLKDGGSALYSFVVWDATNIQVIEAGEIIKVINGPASTTSQGTAKGRTTYGIRTGDSNTFDTVLLAKNASGKQEKKLTLSFDTKLVPRPKPGGAPQLDSKTEARSPKWLPQLATSASYTPPTTSNPSPSRPNPPEFFKCPSNCDNCLKPDDAAARGYTQRCSEQPCYYSPDNQQKWYCYSKPATIWCCRDGKVYEATKEQCAQMGGTAYATQAEAIRACQQAIGWCCRDGKVYEATKEQCAQMGGITWYATQAEAIRACQQTVVGWFCRDGKVYQGTQLQAAQAGATWYATQAEATRVCQPPSSPMGWCCIRGSVSQATQAQCAQMGGTWYATQAEATKACQPPPSPMGWCCIKGSVSQATQAQCAQMGGTWYATQAEATRACRQTIPR